LLPNHIVPVFSCKKALNIKIIKIKIKIKIKIEGLGLGWADRPVNTLSASALPLTSKIVWH
jgi:hypothetical protein